MKPVRPVFVHPHNSRLTVFIEAHKQAAGEEG